MTEEAPRGGWREETEQTEEVRSLVTRARGNPPREREGKRKDTPRWRVDGSGNEKEGKEGGREREKMFLWLAGNLIGTGRRNYRGRETWPRQSAKLNRTTLMTASER